MGKLGDAHEEQARAGKPGQAKAAGAGAREAPAQTPTSAPAPVEPKPAAGREPAVAKTAGAEPGESGAASEPRGGSDERDAPVLGEEPAEEYEARPGLLRVLHAGDTVAVAALGLAIASIVGSNVLDTLSLTLMVGPSTDAGPDTVRFFLASSLGNILLAVMALVLGVAVLRKTRTDERYWVVPVAGAAVLLAVVTLLLIAAGTVTLRNLPSDPAAI